MTTAVEPARDHGLLIGDPDAIRLAAVRAPHLSVIQWLIAAGAPRGARSAFASAVALAAPPGAARVIAALGMPFGQLPEFLVQLAPDRDASVADNVAALRDAPEQALADEVATWGGRRPAVWQAALDRPREWRDGFVRGVESAWALGRGRWAAGRIAIDREISRIGTAAVTGTLPALLNSLHPRLQYRDGVLRFRNSCPTTVPLGGRRLALVPALMPTSRTVVSFERDDVAYLVYPVPGAYRSAPSGADRLELVIGQLRALALRRLEQPATMQVLAGRIHCAPSTATYHCDVLESAGLVVRERRGSSVWVSRTASGDALVDLLS